MNRLLLLLVGIVIIVFALLLALMFWILCKAAREEFKDDPHPTLRKTGTPLKPSEASSMGRGEASAQVEFAAGGKCNDVTCASTKGKAAEDPCESCPVRR